MEKCLKRKYKKPLLKECIKKNLNVNESMTLEELCHLLHGSTRLQQAQAPKQRPKQRKQMIQLPQIPLDNQQSKKDNELVQFINKVFTEKKDNYQSMIHFINYHFTKDL